MSKEEFVELYMNASEEVKASVEQILVSCQSSPEHSSEPVRTYCNILRHVLFASAPSDY